MSKWFKNPMKSRIAFYLPSNVQGKEMPAAKRKKLIGATMAFLVKRLGGGTQIEVLGSFEGAGGKVVQENVTICYAFASREMMEEQEQEINQNANTLCIKFQQESIAVEKDNWFYLFAPNKTYVENYRKFTTTAKEHGTEFGYEKWLKVSVS